MKAALHVLGAIVACSALMAPAVGAQEKGTVRLAILVGNDTGSSERAPLRYAEEDIGRVRKALLEVGGFDAWDIHLLAGKGRADLAESFQTVRQRIAKRPDGARVLLFFYFSGHSDGAALELGGDSVPFQQVRRWMEESGAALRIAVVDSCFGGGLTALKGVRKVPEFDIEVMGDLAAEGSVVLTASGPREMAQESSEAGGGVFTSHFVSGLYGAADDDGDLRVTLRELYRYVYGRTVGSTVGTLAGPQHPSYGYEMEGKGDVVLAMVTGKAAVLRFPVTMPGDFFVLELPGREVVAQVTQDGTQERRLFLAGGGYSLLRREAGSMSAASVELGEGESRDLAERDFSPTTLTLADVRGDSPRGRTALVGFYALSGWIMPEMGVMHGAGILLRRRVAVFDLQARLAYGQAAVTDNGFSYDFRAMEAAFSSPFALSFHRFDLLFGPTVAVSRFSQESSMKGSRAAWAVAPGLLAGANLVPLEHLDVLLAWELSAVVMRRDGNWVAEPVPRALLGVGYAF
ncbi:MAG: hypothetical protein FJ109_05295 [Deltaproteobacteria bacterium]|nr:hypothetical protein [Deltaproteobacteria bacterium]